MMSARRDSWKRAYRSVWTLASFHELGLLSAGLAFYCFLSVTPLIAATVMLYGLAGDRQHVAAQVASLTGVIPSEAARLLQDQLERIVATSAEVSGMALAVSLGLALFGGMQAARGMISALNVIDDVHETRSMMALAIRAGALTLAAVVIAITGIACGGAFAWLQSRAGGGSASHLAFTVLTWAMALLLGSAGFAMIMRLGPDRAAPGWRHVAPGAVLATVLWLGVSFGFSAYVVYLGNYNATYGSLAAVVVFLMWLYLCAYGVLLGALLNVELGREDEARGLPARRAFRRRGDDRPAAGRP